MLDEMELSNTITIDRPIHDVFVFVANLENVPQWNDAIVETRKTSDDPAGIGTTYRQIRAHGALRLTAPLEPGRVLHAVTSNLDALKTLLEDAHRSERGHGSPTSGRGS